MVINPIVGVYIPIIRIPIKGGMTIPNIATFDHGTCVYTVDGLFSKNPSRHGTALELSLSRWNSPEIIRHTSCPCGLSDGHEFCCVAKGFSYHSDRYNP